MSHQRYPCDYLIIGAGIMGLSLARQLKRRHPDARIVLLEKESQLGIHASGRNSGVLHSGIYYPQHSLKAKLCAAGAQALKHYCQQYQLPIKQIGKLILPTKLDDERTCLELLSRAQANGVHCEYIDNNQLTTLEPLAYSATGKAIYCPDTAVIDPKAILQQLQKELLHKKIQIFFNQECTHITSNGNIAISKDKHFAFKHLFNTAGLHADTIAKYFNQQLPYRLLPFKGYYYSIESNNLSINHLLYPVPNLNLPFLGIHVTKDVHNRLSIGPSALPVLGRENYQRLDNINLGESVQILVNLLRLYASNKQSFRHYTHIELSHMIKYRFAKAAQCLLPSLRVNQLSASNKSGIRAQLLDTRNHELVTDFVVEQLENSTHILNAVSPGFTSAFAFADYVLDNYSWS